mgnify:CR=1 FL=1
MTSNGTIKIVISKDGAIAFAGFNEELRDGVSDACAYRRLVVAGSATAKMALARAEILAGRKVDNAQVAAGTHSHDGGKTWSPGH